MMLGLRVTSAHAAAIVAASVLLVHLVVYAVEFRQREAGPGGRRWWQLLLKEGVSAYALSLLVAAYLLWTFGRIGADVGWGATRDMIVVLGVATSLGAAAGELLI